MVFMNSEWIWTDRLFDENEYAEFYDILNWEAGMTRMNISVYGDYTLFVNGKYIASNQYGDFEHYKVYDSIDITDKLIKGRNHICILVWYFGRSGMRYLTETPGLIYEVVNNEKVMLVSNQQTQSRRSLVYECGGQVHKITSQLGYSFRYDATKEDGWLSGEYVGFSDSVVIQSKKNFYKRPIKKHVIEPICKGEIIHSDNRYIIDLGKEFVGLCSFVLNSEKAQSINIAYGELLVNGHVKRIIGNRNFSFDYLAKPGINEYTNYMLRLACRYIEIECEYPIDISYVGILPQTYPVTEGISPVNSELDKRIYESCVNTLKLCMMEHYVDCPWREQCLYAFDSRNQMLSGYYAFADKNLDYARANLLLISKDRREDRLLSICCPSGENLVIPSFSLYYVVAVNEYLQYSKDISLAEEVFDKIEDVLGVFVDNMQDGLFGKFAGRDHWNFYDWSDYAEGKLHCDDGDESDFMINAIAIYALESFDEICRKLVKVNKFKGIAEAVREKVRLRFFNEATETFFMTDKEEEPTELANSFAILTGIVGGELKSKIAQRLADHEFLPCSLSMKGFKYDALLHVDKVKYKDTILDEIRAIYKPMLDEGFTTVWETADGAEAFNSAGSLCHGWSAIPIYYYNDLLDQTK